ncbi:BQ5605_C003g02380 [Microbotryum silenes-dioicae]|uniref:BQ5605_C003g02380 protein n=1 Tax=Microbotryum silenes-dioicae TaxID=796604 RepID=A0A2X0P438_9BASI|nr:BQ5605_C003g02380 [Microbotryum silenes-dioicae]
MVDDTGDIFLSNVGRPGTQGSECAPSYPRSQCSVSALLGRQFIYDLKIETVPSMIATGVELECDNVSATYSFASDQWEPVKLTGG